MAANAIVLPQNSRILAGHRAIAHVLLIAIAIGGLTTRIVGHPTAEHLLKLLIIRTSNNIFYQATHIQGMMHGPGKVLRITLTRKVESVDIFGVAPLMKCGRGLVILQSLEYGAIDHHLVILELSPHHTERVVLLMVIDLHLAQSRRSARGYPLLLVVIVHHHGGPGPDYTLLTGNIIEGKSWFRKSN